jgi:hypothetical protein
MLLATSRRLYKILSRIQKRKVNCNINKEAFTELLKHINLSIFGIGSE